MVNSYTISIINNSGTFKKYFLFNAVPEVTNVVQANLWSNVFSTANAAPGDQVDITIYQQYFAVVGSSSGSPKDGVTVNVRNSKPVNLGSIAGDGTKTAGTSIVFDVKSNSPYFSDTSVDSNGDVNAFQIRAPDAGSNFTAQDAIDGNYIVGIGASANGSTFKGPAATFIPEPGTDYQIKPKNIFYVSFGDYQEGDMISYKAVANKTATADFSSSTKKVMKFVNDDRNAFVKQNA